MQLSSQLGPHCHVFQDVKLYHVSSLLCRYCLQSNDHCLFSLCDDTEHGKHLHTFNWTWVGELEGNTWTICSGVLCDLTLCDGNMQGMHLSYACYASQWCKASSHLVLWEQARQQNLRVCMDQYLSRWVDDAHISTWIVSQTCSKQTNIQTKTIKQHLNKNHKSCNKKHFVYANKSKTMNTTRHITQKYVKKHKTRHMSKKLTKTRQAIQQESQNM